MGGDSISREVIPESAAEFDALHSPLSEKPCGRQEEPRRGEVERIRSEESEGQEWKRQIIMTGGSEGADELLGG